MKFNMKSMKNYIFYPLALLITILSSCGGSNCITGSGEQIVEQRNIGDFSKLEISGDFKVLIFQSDSSSMSIMADDNIIPHVKQKISGDVLTIELDEDICDGGPVAISLSSKTWNAIKASGAVEVIGESKITAQDFELDLSGATDVALVLEAARLTTNTSGAAEISLKGQSRQHFIETSGSSTIRAFDFVVSDYRIESSGASDAQINVLNGLEVKSSGQSNIVYKGNPKTIKRDESGAASITQAN
jgi:hypothetical protein